MFVQHPLIKEETIEEREYQVNLAEVALNHSSLIVLPTGMGKTVIALLVIADILKKKGGKVLFLAPTKPLVEQHASFVEEHLVGQDVVVMTGEVSPEEREALWIENNVIVSTPQVVANDLKYERVTLRDVNLIVFDEAHRAVGKYAYVKVAEAYSYYDGLTLGITASPGSDRSRIREVCENLGIEKIEVRTEKDADVKNYVQDIKMDWVEVEIPPEMKRIRDDLQKMYDSYLDELEKMGVIDGTSRLSKKALIQAGSRIRGKLEAGERKRSLYRALSLQAMALKVGHALELVETQGISALVKYIERLEEEASSDEGSKASRKIVNSERFIRMKEFTRNLDMEHPKIGRIIDIVSGQLSNNPRSRVIVFTHYRDTCDLVTAKFNDVEGVEAGKLVGQSKRFGNKGLNQKEQVALLDRFRDGELNVLVATSVGEEGLDVASTDMVIFYEPVPSEIRTIQRRGRTGRQRPGRVVILMARGTRDETYYYSSLRKERAMRSRLDTIQEEIEGGRKTRDQSTLMDFN